MTDRTDQPSAAPATPDPASEVPQVVVRYWAAARSAAGVESDVFDVSGPLSLADVLVRVRAEHADRPSLESVLAVCSALVGDRPVGSQEATDVTVRPGDIVELLPPFAGG